MRIVLLVSSFHGLTQRVWCALADAGHDVRVQLAGDPGAVVDSVERINPALVLCPFLLDKVPSSVWQRWKTVIVHPGPVTDHGPGSLDRAITHGAERWGVTALQKTSDGRVGPIWASRTFDMPAVPLRKTEIYNGPISDATIDCVWEVVAKAADPAYRPPGIDRELSGVRAIPAGLDRTVSWDLDADSIVRTIRAADGDPGVLTEIGGEPFYAYDAHVDGDSTEAPGTVIGHHQDAVLISAGRGSIWLGQLRTVPTSHRPTVKLPAWPLLAELSGPGLTVAAMGRHGDRRPTFRPIRYQRRDDVGYLTLDSYNGALSTAHCRRILRALRSAIAQDTRVLVLRGGWSTFSNGIHLGVIQASAQAATEAWANVVAITAICKEIITCGRQVTIGTYTGNAGAGGVMLALGADVVVGRDGVVLNPYYDMGLFGSGLHSYTLPRRVGAGTAERLLTERLPVSIGHAAGLGLVDAIGPRSPKAFTSWLAEFAERYAERGLWREMLAAKRRILERDAVRMPLEAYQAAELGEMTRDIFGDRSGFATARAAFVYKQRNPAGRPYLTSQVA